MDCKEDTHIFVHAQAEKPTWRRKVLASLSTIACSLVLVDLAARLFDVRIGSHVRHWSLGAASGYGHIETNTRKPSEVVYNLTLSQAWRNPDGGHWRPLYVGNSETPFPTINAWEGDSLKINIHNENLMPINLHYVGFNHHSATWNDGAAGVTNYPILPRGNFTHVLDTTGQWGLKWYLDHVSTPTVDGNYGTIWIRPSPERERPYHLVSSNKQDQQDMLEAEGTPEHIVMYNYQHREMPNLLAQLQGEGYDPYCFQSVLINGKGRVHCRPADVTTLAGKAIDSHGCVHQPSGALGYPECKPSKTPYEIIETNNRRWMLLNFVNPGLEHPWRISIDKHKMWIVANDGGFVQPQKVDILTVTNAERVTVMIKLDQEAKDYPIRFHALSDLQTLQGYAILRYPHRRFGPRLGEPMPQPHQCCSIMELDGSPRNGAVVEDKAALHPYPAIAPPESADITLRFKATGAPDPKNHFVTNCSMNGTSWQLFREFLDPFTVNPDNEIPGLNPIVKNLPLGSVVDIVVENDLPVTIPVYKHNKPTYALGSGDTKFDWEDVAAAAKDKPDLFNLKNPPLGYLHELPAGGWLAVRWKITEPAVTMFHVFRVRYYVLGMITALLEGDDALPKVPENVKNQPHPHFDPPKDGGIFD